jgi:hypothetical protein
MQKFSSPHPVVTHSDESLWLKSRVDFLCTYACVIGTGLGPGASLFCATCHWYVYRMLVLYVGTIWLVVRIGMSIDMVSREHFTGQLGIYIMG